MRLPFTQAPSAQPLRFLVVMDGGTDQRVLGELLRKSLLVMNSLRFELLVGAADILLVVVGIHLSGAARGALPVSCLLMVLVVVVAFVGLVRLTSNVSFGSSSSSSVIGTSMVVDVAPALMVPLPLTPV